MYYPCGFVCFEHDHVDCDGQPPTGPLSGVLPGDRIRHDGEQLIAHSYPYTVIGRPGVVQVYCRRVDAGGFTSVVSSPETQVEYVFA